MACRDEHPTDTNTVGEATILRDLRLERIAHVWEDRCTRKYNDWIDEYNRRVREANAQVEADNEFIDKYQAWLDKCSEVVDRVQDSIHDLARRFEANESVTAADWDSVIAGNERKVFAALSPLYPREMWPRSVPYLNLIALWFHDEEEQVRREQYMRQYHAAIQDIKRRGEDTSAMKRIIGDTSEGIGFETPLTEAQVSEYRETLHAEKQQLEADKAQFLADLDDTVLARLDGQPVLDKNWDVKAWADSVLQDIGVVATDEASEHVVQQIRDAIQRWPYDAKPICNSSNEVEMIVDQDVHHEREFYLPYDV